MRRGSPVRCRSGVVCVSVLRRLGISWRLVFATTSRGAPFSFVAHTATLLSVARLFFIAGSLAAVLSRRVSLRRASRFFIASFSGYSSWRVSLRRASFLFPLTQCQETGGYRNQRNVERAERDASPGPQVLSRSGEPRDDRRTQYRGGMNWCRARAGERSGDVRGV